VPNHSARLLVAFASIGGTPVKISVGKVRKLPPPATLLSAPEQSATPASAPADAGVS